MSTSYSLIEVRRNLQIKSTEIRKLKEDNFTILPDSTYSLLNTVDGLMDVIDLLLLQEINKLGE